MCQQMSSISHSWADLLGKQNPSIQPTSPGDLTLHAFKSNKTWSWWGEGWGWNGEQEVALFNSLMNPQSYTFLPAISRTGLFPLCLCFTVLFWGLRLPQLEVLLCQAPEEKACLTYHLDLFSANALFFCLERALPFLFCFIIRCPGSSVLDKV